MSAYRVIHVEPSEPISFRLKVKERLGDKGLGILGLAGVLLIMGSTFTFGILDLMVTNIRVFYWLHLSSLMLGFFLGVSSRVIDSGWQGYWNED